MTTTTGGVVIAVGVVDHDPAGDGPRDVQELRRRLRIRLSPFLPAEESTEVRSDVGASARQFARQQ
jgi:hypothetical protein